MHNMSAREQHATGFSKAAVKVAIMRLDYENNPQALDFCIPEVLTLESLAYRMSSRRGANSRGRMAVMAAQAGQRAEQMRDSVLSDRFLDIAIT